MLLILQTSILGFFRSKAITKNVLSLLMTAFMVLYFAVIFAAIGFFAAQMTADDSEGSHAVRVGGYFLYFILYSFFTRLFFQKFGFKDFKFYILTGIAKSTIFHYILISSLRSWFNLLPLIGVVVYLIRSYTFGVSIESICAQGLFMMSVLFTSNYIALIAEKYLTIKTRVVVFALVLLSFLLWLDMKDFISLLSYFSSVYGFITQSVWRSFIFLLLAFFCYWQAFLVLKRVAFLEDSYSQDAPRNLAISQGLFDRFGDIGSLMELEAKLIWRSKRSRGFIYMGLIFMLYPLLITRNDGAFLVFLAIFASGSFSITYAQLFLSWNSDHFDLFSTRIIHLADIFRAKFYLLSCIIIMQGLIGLLYGFVKSVYFFAIPAAMLFNIGVALFIYMLASSFTARRIDSSKGVIMNYEGLSFSIYLAIIPIFLLPFGFYYLGLVLSLSWLGWLLIGAVGLIGIIFHERLIRMCVKIFEKRKYQIMASFRDVH
jgi:hypothetical protein